MPSRQLDVIVAGCGIGGLTAAIALRRAGHKVTIYEKSSLFHEVGQGITIAPNGGVILRRLGFDFQKARMVDLVGRYNVDATTLKPQTAYIDMEGVKAFNGLPSQTAYRVNLQATLVELAKAKDGDGEPVTILPGDGIERCDGRAGAMTLTPGKTIRSDLVIAADGVKSMAAAHILGKGFPEIDSGGTIVYRFTLSKDEILSDRLTAPLLANGEGVCSFYISPMAGKWLVRYWCRDDGLQNLALYVLRSYEDAERQEHELRFRTDRQALLNEMVDFHPALRRVAEMTTDVLPLWRCTTREPLTRFHLGKMVVLGDAAHPVKPHMGAGAISAIEDAGMLGVLFRDFPDTSDVASQVEERLALFSELRVARAAALKYYSDVPFFQSAEDEQRENVEKCLKPEEVPATREELVRWFMGYDAITDAEAALGRLESAKGTT